MVGLQNDEKRYTISFCNNGGSTLQLSYYFDDGIESLKSADDDITNITSYISLFEE